MLLNSRQAAEYLGLSPDVMKARRSRGALPIPYLKFGKRTIRYKVEDLQKFLEDYKVDPQNEKSPTDSDKPAG